MERKVTLAVIAGITALLVVSAVAATYHDMPETRVAAPAARLSSGETRTVVDAPFARVEDKSDTTHVRAPFVDIEVDKDAGRDG